MGFSEIAGGIFRAVFPKSAPFTTAVVLAGGCGTRMQSPDGVKKQFRMLCGVPVLAHTLRAFDDCPQIKETVVVSCADEIDCVRSLAEQYGIKKLSTVVAGGETRKASALRGFMAINKKASYVAIHDAARCLIRAEDISAVATAAYAYGAATAVFPVTDTLKSVTEDGFVEKTIPRDRVFHAATPQIFSCDLYRAAVYTAEKDNIDVTDDNMLMEYIGQRVKIVDCGDENLKITTERDFYRAEAILKERIAHDGL